MALHAQRSEKGLSAGTKHLLTGLVYCGICGAKMRYQKWGNAGFKLVCYSQQISKPYLVKDPDCDNETVWAEDIEKAVIADLMEMTADEIGSEDSETPVSLSETLLRKKALLEQKLRRLYDLYSDSGNIVLLASINEQTDEIKKLEGKIKEEESRGLWTKNAEEAKKQLQNIRETWNYMDIQERRNLICSVIDKITVTHNSVRLDYRY